jgi:hypothetical protein
MPAVPTKGALVSVSVFSCFRVTRDRHVSQTAVKRDWTRRGGIDARAPVAFHLALAQSKCGERTIKGALEPCQRNRS